MEKGKSTHMRVIFPSHGNRTLAFIPFSISHVSAALRCVYRKKKSVNFPIRNDSGTTFIRRSFSGHAEPEENIEYIFVCHLTAALPSVDASRMPLMSTEEKWWRARDETRLLNAAVTFAHVNLLFSFAIDAMSSPPRQPSSLRLPHFTFHLVSSLRRAFKRETGTKKKKQQTFGARKTNDRVIVYTRRKLYTVASRTLAIQPNTHRPSRAEPGTLKRARPEKKIIRIVFV